MAAVNGTFGLHIIVHTRLFGRSFADLIGEYRYHHPRKSTNVRTHLRRFGLLGVLICSLPFFCLGRPRIFTSMLVFLEWLVFSIVRSLPPSFSPSFP